MLDTTNLGGEILSFAAPDALRKVPCPEMPAWDGRLFVRRVSAAELDVVVARDDDRNSRARYAALFACNENGKRLWFDDQAEQLGDRPGLLWLIERITHYGRTLNGLSDENRKAAEKNFEAAEESGSPGSSAAPATRDTASTGGG
jgi:hypothetical protein